MRLQVHHDERVVAKPAAVPRVVERGVGRGLPRVLPHAADAVVPAVELHHHVALDLAGLLVREDDPLRVVAPVARRGDELDAGNLPVEGVRHVLHRRAEVIPDVRPVGLNPTPDASLTSANTLNWAHPRIVQNLRNIS